METVLFDQLVKIRSKYDLIPKSLLLQLGAGRNFEKFIVEYFRHRALLKHQLYIICLCSLFWHLWPSSIRNVSVLQIVLDLYLSWCFSLRFWKPVLGDVDKKNISTRVPFLKNWGIFVQKHLNSCWGHVWHCLVFH